LDTTSRVVCGKEKYRQINVYRLAAVTRSDCGVGGELRYGTDNEVRVGRQGKVRGEINDQVLSTCCGWEDDWRPEQ
jgi:hypothetical protein